MTAHFQDQVYLLKRSAPLYDTVRDLNHTTTFANDRIVAFQTVLKLTTTLFNEAATESPARLAYYFQHTAKDWIFIVHHICHHTLRPTSANTTDIDFDVSFEERHLGLHLLKSILLLWPPSCQWELPDLLLPRIFTASANARRERIPRLEIESMKLMIVDVVLAWCCASKTVVCYRPPAQPVALMGYEASDKQTNTDNSCGSNYSEHEGPAPEGQQESKTGKNVTTAVAVDKTNLMTMTTELSQLVHQTFQSLSSCCTFLNDPSNMFDPTQLKKQHRNKLQFLKAFEGLNAFGTLILRNTAAQRQQPVTGSTQVSQ